MSILGKMMTMVWFMHNFMMRMGNDVLLFRVNTKEQLEAYGGIDGSSGSWDVVSKTYKTS